MKNYNEWLYRFWIKNMFGLGNNLVSVRHPEFLVDDEDNSVEMEVQANIESGRFPGDLYSFHKLSLIILIRK